MANLRPAAALRIVLPRTTTRTRSYTSQLLLHQPVTQQPGARQQPAAALHTQPARHRDRRPVGPDGQRIPDTPPPTDFERLDVLGATPAPATSVEACLPDGFRLGGGASVLGGAGALLVGGEAFAWRPWMRGGSAGMGSGPRLVNEKGQWEVPDEAFGLLGLVWPKPGRY